MVIQFESDQKGCAWSLTSNIMPPPSPPLVLLSPLIHLPSQKWETTDTVAQSESEELAVLDKVVHIGQNGFDSAEFVLQESGPVLKYRLKLD